MKNIVLIGMPASGKSTVGVILAKTLGIGFVDTDLVIQQRENALLQDIINEKGLQCFLDKERDAILSLECENCVVATGGSVVFRDEAMQKLKRNSVIVFIDVPLKNVKARLKNIKTRGVAAPKNQTIDDIFFERLPLYKKYADITVDTADLSPEETVSRIIFFIKKLIILYAGFTVYSEIIFPCKLTVKPYFFIT